jgi:hypothetical protein
MKKDGKKDHPSQPVRHNKAGSDGNSVEKSVNHQTHKDGVALVRGDELVRVGFFAKMKMRRDRVLKKIAHQVSLPDQDERVVLTQDSPVPIPPDDNSAAKYVGSGRRRAQQ